MASRPNPKTTFDAYQPTTFDELWKMCTAAARSAFFRSIDRPDDAFVLFTWAQEHGVPVSEAWANCFQINGAIVVGVHLQTAMILRHTELVEAYEIRESTPTRATFYGRRAGGQEHEVTFTWDDAIKANLHGKDNYKRHPADMLLKMAKVRVHRALWADVLGGAVYDADEMRAGLAPPPPSPEEIAALNTKMGAPTEAELAEQMGAPDETAVAAFAKGGEVTSAPTDGDIPDAHLDDPPSDNPGPDPEEPPHDPETGEVDPAGPAREPQKEEIRELLRASGVWPKGVHWRTAWKEVDAIIGSHVPPGKLTEDLADMVIVTLRGRVKASEDAPPTEEPYPPGPGEEAPSAPPPNVASKIRNGNGPDVFWARAVRAATDGETLEKLVVENAEDWIGKFDPEAMSRLVEAVKARAVELDRPDLAKAFDR